MAWGTRYGQLISLIAKHKPKTILEVGTHKGIRAIRMCEEACRHGGHVHYLGFDVFDTMDEGFHTLVGNGKGAAAEQVVRKKLDGLKKKYDKFTYTLEVGDTQDTLHGCDLAYDFVFIDGDHRLEMIIRDYEAVKNSKLVVFDDYYTKSKEFDIAKYGCNGLIDKAKGKILPKKDNIDDRFTIQLAMIG